jgi:iron(III) transport system substrate-binding protein
MSFLLLVFHLTTRGAPPQNQGGVFCEIIKTRRDIMKKCVYHLGFVSLCVVLFFGVTSGLCYADSSADLYPLAKKEGVIHFGGATSIEAMASTLKAFEEKYPGVKIQYNRKSSEALMSLIETERKANKVSFDLIKTSEPFDALELKNVGYWLQYRHENWAAIPDKFKDKDAYYVASNVGAMPGAYNPKVIPPSEAPKSLKDVIDPRWKNKMSHSSPSRAGTG